MAERLMETVPPPPGSSSGSKGPEGAIATAKTGVPKDIEKAFEGEPESKTNLDVSAIENTNRPPGGGGFRLPGWFRGGQAQAEEAQEVEAQEQQPEAGGPPADGSGEGRGDGTPGGGGPEGPRVPQTPEYLTSPERGRDIVKEIVRLEATLRYTERYGLKATDSRLDREYLANHPIYSEREGIYLDQLYIDLKDYTRALRRVRNQRDPWNPIPETQQVVGRIRDRGERPPVLPTGTLNALFEKYKGTNVDAVEGDLATYFQGARALGLLDRADAIFSSTYKQIIQGNIPAEQVEEILEKNTDLARRAIEGAFRARRIDPAVANLQGIAEVYTTRTADIFQLILMDEAYNPIEGEFRFGEDMDVEEDTEKYWRDGHYPKMYEIIAKTKKQFSRAKDTFLSMITGGALGKSPDELYEHFNNFTEKFSQTASAEGIEDEYIMDSRLELTGRGFVFGGDYSFESYNMKSANQFLMAMALHEGPQRWVSVARSGNGGVGEYLWKFDYDPRVTLMHNPGGSRGQLLNDTVTQHYLHRVIRNILIEEGMGVVMKDYDPRDEGSVAYDPKSIRVLNISEADEHARELALQANVARIGIPQPKEEFIGLYDGFSKGDAHEKNYQWFEQQHEDLNKEGFEQAVKDLPSGLRKSVIVGRVQEKMRGRVVKSRYGEDQIKKYLLDVIDNLIAEDQLTDRDKRIWAEAYDQSKANFETAFQMVGAMGEKARRGGGVFFIDRKDEQGRRLFVDNMPVYLAEKFVQTAVTLTKIKYADDAEIWNRAGFSEQIKKTPNFKARYRTAMVEIARNKAIRGIKTDGFEAKLYDADYIANYLDKAANYIDKLNKDGNLDKIDSLQAGSLKMVTLKKLKENPGGTLFRNLDGSTVIEEILVDFDTAVKSVYSRWTNHTYWSYQPENRHMLTDPDVFAAAKRIRAGISRPEDEDNLATFLLLVDPTLKRVARLEDTQVPDGESAQQQEIMLFDAAVEASNQGHWTIVRELNAAFMDPEGNPFKMRTGYNLEDYSGIARFIIRMRQFVASNPKRFARRYAAELANLPVNVSSMPDQWGQTGVMGAIEMFADPVGDMSEQKIASQFAITKWVEQMRIGNMLFEALVGRVDSERGFSIEGLFEKPTNNSDKLIQIWDKLKTHGISQEETENEFFYALMESFDRLWIVLKLVRTMESDTRNAQGALDLEKTEVFVADGKVNPAIVLEDLGKNTGSSRHTEKIFFNKYIDWLLSPEPGRGQAAYPSEVKIYEFLKQPYFYVDRSGTIHKDGRTWAGWLFDKMAR